MLQSFRFPESSCASESSPAAGLPLNELLGDKVLSGRPVASDQSTGTGVIPERRLIATMTSAGSNLEAEWAGRIQIGVQRISSMTPDELFRAERIEGIYGGGAARGKVAGEQGNAKQ